MNVYELGCLSNPHRIEAEVTPALELSEEGEEKFYYVDDPDGLKINIIAR